MLTIKTNNVPRHTIDAWELTTKERQEFDYLDWPTTEGDMYPSATFFRYKGQVYDLGEFMRCDNVGFMAVWDGYSNDTAWSGVLVRYVDEGESVIVGTYYS